MLVTKRQREELEAILKIRTTSPKLALRAKIILLTVAGNGVHETAKELGIGRATVRRWIQRWRESGEAATIERLSDATGTRDNSRATFQQPEAKAGSGTEFTLSYWHFLFGLVGSAALVRGVYGFVETGIGETALMDALFASYQAVVAGFIFRVAIPLMQVFYVFFALIGKLFTLIGTHLHIVVGIFFLPAILALASIFILLALIGRGMGAILSVSARISK